MFVKGMYIYLLHTREIFSDYFNQFSLGNILQYIVNALGQYIPQNFFIMDSYSQCYET